MTPAERRASLSLTSIVALRMLGLFLILPVFSVHAQTLPGGGDALLVGIALGIYGFTQASLQLAYGAASDRWGRRPVITAGLLVFAAGSLLAAAAPDIHWVIVGRALQGAGAISAAVTAFLADSTRESQRTKAMAMVGASIGFTFVLSLVVAPVLYRWIGMAGLFGMTGVLALLAIVALWRIPEAPRAEAAAPLSRGALRAVLVDRELLRLNLGIFALHLTQMAVFVVIPPLLVAGAGLPVDRHWEVYLPVAVLSFALALPPILRAERVGRLKPLFVASVAAMAVVQLAFALVPPTVLALASVLLVYFVFFNVLEALLPSVVSRVAPAAAKGTALGVYNTTQSFGLFVGGGVGGWVAKHHGPGEVFALAAVLCLAWLSLCAGMREVGGRRPAPAAAPAAQAE